MTNSVPVFGGPYSTDPRERSRSVRIAPPLVGDAGVVTLRLGKALFADPQLQSLELNLGSGLGFESGSPYKVVVKHDDTLTRNEDGSLRVTVTTDRVFSVDGQQTVAQQVKAIHEREDALEAQDASQRRLLDLRRRRNRLARGESRSGELRARGLSARGV